MQVLTTTSMLWPLTSYFDLFHQRVKISRSPLGIIKESIWHAPGVLLLYVSPPCWLIEPRSLSGVSSIKRKKNSKI